MARADINMQEPPFHINANGGFIMHFRRAKQLCSHYLFICLFISFSSLIALTNVASLTASAAENYGLELAERTFLSK